VTTTGIVSVDPFGSFFKNHLFVQDDNEKWSGVMIKHTAETSMGDSVSLTGTVADDFGIVTTLIDVSNFEIHKPDVGSIDPIPVTTGEIATGGEFAEAYEGVLVKVTGTCDNDNLGFREWSVDDGSGPVRIYHPLSNEISSQIGTNYEVTGVQYFRNDEYKVLVLDPGNVIENPQSLTNIEIGPKVYKLYQNYPNPFNLRTIINYELPISNEVELSIYNLLGQKLVTLVLERQKAGYHQIEWDATHFPSGIYYYKIKAGEFQAVKKMILIQ